jgi:hypothetical protein
LTFTSSPSVAIYTIDSAGLEVAKLPRLAVDDSFVAEERRLIALANGNTKRFGSFLLIFG